MRSMNPGGVERGMAGWDGESRADETIVSVTRSGTVIGWGWLVDFLFSGYLSD